MRIYFQHFFRNKLPINFNQYEYQYIVMGNLQCGRVLRWKKTLYTLFSPDCLQIASQLVSKYLRSKTRRFAEETRRISLCYIIRPTV